MAKIVAFGGKFWGSGAKKGGSVAKIRGTVAKIRGTVAKSKAHGVKIGPPRPGMEALGPISGHLGSRTQNFVSQIQLNGYL
jgi:hypothetical protein